MSNNNDNICPFCGYQKIKDECNNCGKLLDYYREVETEYKSAKKIVKKDVIDIYFTEKYMFFKDIPMGQAMGRSLSHAFGGLVGMGMYSVTEKSNKGKGTYRAFPVGDIVSFENPYGKNPLTKNNKVRVVLRNDEFVFNLQVKIVTNGFLETLNTLNSNKVNDSQKYDFISPADKSKVKFCDKCGNKLTSNSKFCDRCGNKIIK